MEIEKVLEGLGKVLDSGKRDEFQWFDVDTKPLTKDAQTQLENEFQKKGLFVKVINAGSALNKATGKEVQRIWLVSFDSQDKLNGWLSEFEERKKKDHRYIGEQLEWFHVQEDIVGPGLPLFHPKGMLIRLGLIEMIRESNARLGAMEVFSPHIAKADLWKISGHYDHYRDKMFIWEQEGEEWGVKAMNCPMHIQIYRFRPRSYKELPIRYAEFGTVYRKEQSGELHGLSRVWGFTQDDHHFFVRPDQIKEEVSRIIKEFVWIYKTFGFEYKMKLATRPEDSMGDDSLWEIAERSLKDALDETEEAYGIKDKDGAFYGPKIDFYVKDSMGREWQLGTIQIDFFMPENFKLKYTTADSKEEMPVIVHFAGLGSIERFMSIIIENKGGRLPLWLAPDQVKVLPVSDAQKEYAEKIVNELRASGIRAEMEIEGTLGKRIRDAQIQKVAVIAVVGDKEKQANTVDVRGQGQLSIEEFKEKLILAIMDRQETL